MPIWAATAQAFCCKIGPEQNALTSSSEPLQHCQVDVLKSACSSFLAGRISTSREFIEQVLLITEGGLDLRSTTLKRICNLSQCCRWISVFEFYYFYLFLQCQFFSLPFRQWRQRNPGNEVDMAKEVEDGWMELCAEEGKPSGHD